MSENLRHVMTITKLMLRLKKLEDSLKYINKFYDMPLRVKRVSEEALEGINVDKHWT